MSRSPGAPPLIRTTMFSRLLRSGCCVVSLEAAYRKCSEDERRTAQKDMMSEAYHDAGPSQWMVSGIGHEKEPITAAARRLALIAASESEGVSIYRGLGLTYRELDKSVFVQLPGLPLMQALVYQVGRIFVFDALGQPDDGEERVLSVESIIWQGDHI